MGLQITLFATDSVQVFKGRLSYFQQEGSKNLVQVVSCLKHNSCMQTCITNLQNYPPVNNCAMAAKQHSIGVLEVTYLPKI